MHPALPCVASWLLQGADAEPVILLLHGSILLLIQELPAALVQQKRLSFRRGSMGTPGALQKRPHEPFQTDPGFGEIKGFTNQDVR